jgi:hypothetical protein
LARIRIIDAVVEKLEMNNLLAAQRQPRRYDPSGWFDREPEVRRKDRQGIWVSSEKCVAEDLLMLAAWIDGDLGHP